MGTGQWNQIFSGFQWVRQAHDKLVNSSSRVRALEVFGYGDSEALYSREQQRLDLNEFSEDEWQDIFDEVRLLVNRAGYSDWDSAAFDSLSEVDEIESDGSALDRPPDAQPSKMLVPYLSAFIRFLKARSSHSIERHTEHFARLVSTESGDRVDGFFLSINGQELPLTAGMSDLDAMISVIGSLLSELQGVDGAFWDRDGLEPGDEL